jgi:hypothetical protein
LRTVFCCVFCNIGYVTFAGEPLSAKQCDKQKAFETVAAGLKVDASGSATWNGKDSLFNNCILVMLLLRTRAIAH